MMFSPPQDEKENQLKVETQTIYPSQHQPGVTENVWGNVSNQQLIKIDPNNKGKAVYTGHPNRGPYVQLFGNHTFESTSENIIQWTFTFNAPNMAFGIVQDGIEIQTEQMFDKSHIFYQFWNQESKHVYTYMKKNTSVKGQEQKVNFGRAYKPNDKITLELNLISKNISIYIDGKYIDTPYKNIKVSDDISYKFGASIVYKGIFICMEKIIVAQNINDLLYITSSLLKVNDILNNCTVSIDSTKRCLII